MIRSLFAPLRYTTYTSTGYINKLKTRHTIPQQYCLASPCKISDSKQPQRISKNGKCWAKTGRLTWGEEEDRRFWIISFTEAGRRWQARRTTKTTTQALRGKDEYRVWRWALSLFPHNVLIRPPCGTVLIGRIQDDFIWYSTEIIVIKILSWEFPKTDHSFLHLASLHWLSIDSRQQYTLVSLTIDAF